jgi:hypothetical protein
MTQDRTPELMTKLSTFWYDRPERKVELASVAYNPHLYRIEGGEKVLSRITVKAWASRGWVQLVRLLDDDDRSVLRTDMHLTDEGWELVAAMAD